MRRGAAVALAGAALAAAPGLARTPPPPRGFAQPSDVVATEIAYARAARAKGFAAATAQFAAPGAQKIGAAGPVRVAAWLARPAAQTLVWSPALVWISCDGSYALSYGAWQAGAAQGWFATIWQRQKKGQYRFVLDQGGPLAAPLADADMIVAHTAACPARPDQPDSARKTALATVRDEIDAGRTGDEDAPAKPARPRDTAPPDPNAADAAAALTADWTHGEARDHTLAWATTIAPDGARRFTVRVKSAGGWAEALAVTAPAP